MLNRSISVASAGTFIDAGKFSLIITCRHGELAGFYLTLRGGDRELDEVGERKVCRGKTEKEMTGGHPEISQLSIKRP